MVKALLFMSDCVSRGKTRRESSPACAKPYKTQCGACGKMKSLRLHTQLPKREQLKVRGTRSRERQLSRGTQYWPMKLCKSAATTVRGDFPTARQAKFRSSACRTCDARWGTVR